MRYPYVANSRWFEDVVGRRIVAVLDIGHINGQLVAVDFYGQVFRRLGAVIPHAGRGPARRGAAVTGWRLRRVAWLRNQAAFTAPTAEHSEAVPKTTG